MNFLMIFSKTSRTLMPLSSILKSHNILTLSFSTTLVVLWINHLTSATKPNFCHSSKCTIVAIFQFRYLYSFWTTFLHSTIKWLIDSSHSPHILHFFCYLGHQCSFLCSSFLVFILVLKISSALFLSSNNLS